MGNMRSFPHLPASQHPVAMTIVATISKLLSSAVLAAELIRKPYIISMGAAMSRTTIAAA